MTRARRGNTDCFVHCCFDDDIKVHAPYDAAQLMRKLGLNSLLGEKDAPTWPPGWQAPIPRRGAQGFSGRRSDNDRS
jgi:hypothetical protein